MSANPDPFDVEALERSLNDSAVRVSTLWVSFLIFGLYLVIAASGTTHSQLFLETPIELPILKIELSLVGFFLLAPVLFVTVHVYLLLQVLLLARTAAAYDEAVEHTFPVSSDGARIRQRLANTLFAQIFAGSPRERQGLLGTLLRSMAWLTLAVAPVAVLLNFEVRFLPYHSHLVTWTHRILIAIDILVVLLLWRAALDAGRDVTWGAAFQLRPGVFMAFGLALLSWVAVTFPGELHASWMRFGSGVPGDCKLSWLGRLDRLSLSTEVSVDGEQLAKIEDRAIRRGLHKAYLGERTGNFQSRDLSCARFDSVDLRRANFADANMRGVVFLDAQLKGALLDGADLTGARLAGFGNQLQEASFIRAELEAANLGMAQLSGAHFGAARLRGANLVAADLSGARLTAADLRGAGLRGTNLPGADLRAARLQGADLTGAELKGADLGPLRSMIRYHDDPLSMRALMLWYELGRTVGASHPLPTIGGRYQDPAKQKDPEEVGRETYLQGANLTRASLQGAVLTSARLEGANLSEAHLQAADLSEAHLQGAQFNDALLEITLLRRAHLWRTTGARCDNAQVVEPQIAVSSTADIEWFTEQVIRDVPEAARQALQVRLRERLIINPIDDQGNARIWRDCEASALTQHEWENRHADYLVKLACTSQVGGASVYLTEAIAFRLIGEAVDESGSPYVKDIARGLLGACPGANELKNDMKQRLRQLKSDRTGTQ